MPAGRFQRRPHAFPPLKSRVQSHDNRLQRIPRSRDRLRFTSGEPQNLVDNYRKRNHQDPCRLLKNLWAELERRFGSASTISNALLERMHAFATFREGEQDKLQEFSDLCADVTSQIFCLPGLACLNFPDAILSIASKLPPSLRRKWEKEIGKFAENSGDTYPGFHVSSEVVQKHARIKSNPNINIGARLTNPSFETLRRTGQNDKALKTNADPNDINAPTRRRDRRVQLRGVQNLRCEYTRAENRMDPSGWSLLSLSNQRPQSERLQTNNPMQYMQGQTPQRTPSQIETEEI